MNHKQHIQQCLELAQKGKGRVSHNPMVGAVLVHNERIIGQGWHERYGHAHAEVNCLSAVADADKALIPESTMYVSLEPCAHHGKTPPCAERIVAEGIKHVVICNTDPHDKVAGKGIQILKDAGIEVTTDTLADAGRWVNRRFFCFHEQKRPYIILKWAQTQDGFIAPADKSRFAITNTKSNRLVHKWRTEEDAIIVGFNTACNDDPQLTARLWDGENPLRIVIDKNLALTKNYKIFNQDAETWILNNSKNTIEDNIHYIQMDFSKDIRPQLLQNLYEDGIQSLIVEGGAVLLNSFIQAGVWDEARVFIGNKLIVSGVSAPELNNATHVKQMMQDADQLNIYVHSGSHYPYVKGCEL